MDFLFEKFYLEKMKLFSCYFYLISVKGKESFIRMKHNDSEKGG